MRAIVMQGIQKCVFLSRVVPHYGDINAIPPHAYYLLPRSWMHSSTVLLGQRESAGTGPRKSKFEKVEKPKDPTKVRTEADKATAKEREAKKKAFRAAQLEKNKLDAQKKAAKKKPIKKNDDDENSD